MHPYKRSVPPLRKEENHAKMTTATVPSPPIPVARPGNGLSTVLMNLALISSGCLVFVVGMQAVMIPAGLFAGGITGLAVLIHYNIPALGVGWGYLLLNIPLAVIGFRTISRRFMAYTAFGMVFFSLAASLIRLPAMRLDDPLLSAVSCGVICGLGSGLILRSLGSAGGLDILAIHLRQRYGLRIGMVAFAGNAAVVMAGVWLYDLRMSLYSVIFIFISGRVIDAVITGFNLRKSVMIISDRSEEMARHIMEKLDRGVTFLSGKGAYTGKDKNVIFTVTTMTELPKLKSMVLSLDPEAFIVINDTLEVYGRRLGKVRVY